MKKNENGDDPPCRAFPGQVKTHASMTGPTRRLRQTAQKDLKRPVMEAARRVPLAIGGELRNLDWCHRREGAAVVRLSGMCRFTSL